MPDTQTRVVVVGSINLDLSVVVPRLPAPGETLLGDSISRAPGGKGANQAVAAARAAGTTAAMVGAVGDDEAGRLLRTGLVDSGVDCAAVATVEGPSGQAVITVNSAGENTIVVVPGANARVRIDDGATRRIRTADVVLGQLEIPQGTLTVAARHRRAGVPFILNAAPAATLDRALSEQVDLLIVNENEAQELSGRTDLRAAADSLSAVFPAVVLTLGPRGALLVSRDTTLEVAAPQVSAVDTVGAGDTFCGVFAAELARGTAYRPALEYACAAASLAVQRPGAQPSVPTAREVERQHARAYGRA